MKRGRPRKFAQELLDSSADEYGMDMDTSPYYSNRQKQNFVYAERAKARILEERWEYGEALDNWPQRVLTELGRCLQRDEALFWRVVDWYAERGWGRLRAEDAAKRLHHMRR